MCVLFLSMMLLTSKVPKTAGRDKTVHVRAAWDLALPVGACLVTWLERQWSTVCDPRLHNSFKRECAIKLIS